MAGVVWQIMQPKVIFRSWSSHRRPKALTGDSSQDSGEELLIPRDLLNNQEKTGQVPRGYLAVYVGPQHRRFVIPASCLSTPDFRSLMDKAAEEFGYEHQGGLKIPCEEDYFQDLLIRHRITSKSRKGR